MKQFGFTLITILFLGLLGYGGYFAIASLKDPKIYVSDSGERIGDLHRVATTTDDGAEKSIYELNLDLAEKTASTTEQVLAATSSTATPSTSLVGRLETLISKNIVLKRGSKGDDVGTIQMFMNEHYSKQSKIDNDFGPRLETDVKKFQAEHKISTTGQLGPQTQKKMLEIAKKQ
jgi:murein L,D-transpeptidase YcbB/YkuD